MIVNDADTLSEVLYRLNERGVLPEVAGYDRADRPIIAWLFEANGEDVYPSAVKLGGEVAEVPELVPLDLADLAYPITLWLADW